jgi:Rrf2 family protein
MALQERSGTLLTAGQIGKAAGVPLSIVSKILQRLVQGQLVHSVKGSSGGYELARPASQISLSEVLHIMGDTAIAENCFLGFSPCDECTPCALHPSWKRIRREIEQGLRRITIADLALAKPRRARHKGIQALT